MVTVFTAALTPMILTDFIFHPIALERALKNLATEYENPKIRNDDQLFAALPDHLW